MSAITYQHSSRRTMLKGALGATAALTLPGVALLGQRSAFAQQATSQSAVAPPLPGTITRRIGKTDEVVPALGLGTFLTFECCPANSATTCGRSCGATGKAACACSTPRRGTATAPA